MATKLTAQLDAVSTCHRHRITPHTAAMLHPLTAAVPFTMLRQLAMPQPSPCYAPLPGEHAVHGATQDAARCGDRRRVLQFQRSSVSYPHHLAACRGFGPAEASRPHLCVHMDLNSDTSSDEEEDAVVAHAAVSLSTTRQPSANKRRAASRPNAEAWLRRSCRPQRSSEIYEAEPATQPRIQEVGVVLGSHVKVYWSGARRWYLGLVDEIREDRNGKRMHHVSYQDGDTKWHHLPSVGWQQVESDEEAPLAAVAASQESVPMGASPSAQSLGSPHARPCYAAASERQAASCLVGGPSSCARRRDGRRSYVRPV